MLTQTNPPAQQPAATTSQTHSLMPCGTWPVMLTPFTEEGGIDWSAYDQLIDWYLASGVAGLFSVCLSSELYCLSEAERLELARRAVQRSNGQAPVIAVGIGSDTYTPATLSHAVRKMEDTGVDAAILLTNYFCPKEATAEHWLAQVEAFLQQDTSAIRLGIYECPLPYARHLPAQALGALAATGRFFMTKDTCCDLQSIRAKIDCTRDTPLRFYNADANTLLASLEYGGHGYSGISANYFPHLFSWMCANYNKSPQLASELSAFFARTGVQVLDRYMQSAKLYLQQSGLMLHTRTRVAEHRFSAEDRDALDALRREVETWEERLSLENPFRLTTGAYR